MALSKKHKHDLIELGIQLKPLSFGALENLLDKAGLDPRNIMIEKGTAQDNWIKIVNHINENRRVDEFLSVLIDQFGSNKRLKEIKEEIAKQSEAGLAQHLKSIIDHRHCVLFLGPHVFNFVENREVVSFSRYLSRQLAAELRRGRVFYEPGQEENLSYIIGRYEAREKFAQGGTERQAQKVYEEGPVYDFYYRAIDKFTFPLIINTNPDLILNRLFGNSRYVFRHYDMTNSPIEPMPGDMEGKTLVYNIFGSFKNVDSIIFTEKEAVEFAKKAYEKDPPIPLEIKAIIKNSYGLFLGFDFRDWHLKILFDVLDLKDKPGNYSISDEDTPIQEPDIEYYSRQYNMTFVDSSMVKFLGALSNINQPTDVNG